MCVPPHPCCIQPFPLAYLNLPFLNLPQLTATYLNLRQLTSTYLTAGHPTSMYRTLPYKQLILFYLLEIVYWNNCPEPNHMTNQLMRSLTSKD